MTWDDHKAKLYDDWFQSNPVQCPDCGALLTGCFLPTKRDYLLASRKRDRSIYGIVVKQTLPA
jgi:hypothetical protein